MTRELERLIINMVNYYIDNKSTIRQTADHFKKSKSIVHIYFQKKLPLINKNLFMQYKKIADINSIEKHIRGGQATKLKYKYEKDNKSNQ